MAIALQPHGRMHDAARPKLRIGEILVAAGALRESDIVKVLSAQERRRAPFGEIALALKVINEVQLKRALAQQYDYPFVEPGNSLLSQELVAAYQPFCEYSEKLRTLRSQLLARWFGSRGAALAVTSARPGEGCSELVANLAIVFAQLGERTLLIDANMRSPRQGDLFGLHLANGLAELLNAHVPWDEALQDVPQFPQLCVLASGTPPNPQELLSRPRFAQLLQQLSTQFDVILIDTPAAAEFADAQIIATVTGGCLLTLKRHHTRLADIHSVKAALPPNVASIVGTVITA